MTRARWVLLFAAFPGLTGCAPDDAGPTAAPMAVAESRLISVPVTTDTMVSATQPDRNYEGQSAAYAGASTRYLVNVSRVQMRTLVGAQPVVSAKLRLTGLACDGQAIKVGRVTRD
jgi:hypothetical protein